MEIDNVGVGNYAKSFASMTTSRADYKSPTIFEEGAKVAHDVDIYTLSNITTPGTVVDFNMESDPVKWTDPQTVELHGKMGIEFRRLQGTVGTIKWAPVSTLTENDNAPKFGLVNNYLRSLFSSCVVYVNDLELGDNTTNAYPYMTYMQTLLSTSIAHRNSNVLLELGWKKDIKTATDAPDTTESGPFMERRKPFLENAMVDFHIPLMNDLNNMEKFLPPGVRLKFALKRNEDKFVLWTPQDNTYEFRIVLSDLKISLRQYEMEDLVQENYKRNYVLPPPDKRGRLRLKFIQNEFKTFAVPKDQTTLKQQNLFSSQHLPDKVYVAVVEQGAFNGDRHKDPFKFEMVNMRRAFLRVNNEMVPNPPYEYDAVENRNSCYNIFLKNTGTGPFEMDGVDVSKDEWKNGYCVYAFDRSPTKDNGLYSHPPTAGTMSLTIETSEPTPKHYMVAVMACYDKALILTEGAKPFVESLIPPRA